jgi:hypothetical protein
MAMTINPAVSRASYRRWLLHVALFALGVSGGALTTYFATRGLYLLVSGVSASAWLLLAISVLVLAALRDLGAPAPVPYRNGKQVPEWLRRMLPTGAVATVYGAELGTGFLTRFTYSAHTAFAVMLAAQAHAGWIALAIAAFAAGKSIVLFTSVAPKGERKFQDRFERRLPSHGFGVLRVGNAALTVATAIILIAT